MISKIYEGTNAIQALDLVGRKLTKEKIDGKDAPGHTMNEWIKDSCEELAAFNTENSVVQDALTALNALQEATDHILVVSAAGQIEEAVTPAENYLKLFDRVAGGVMMARSMVIAQRKTQTPETDHYINQAQVYADNVLPEVSSLLTKVKRGANSVLNTNMNFMMERLGVQLEM
jgi:hypothetical protein